MSKKSKAPKGVLTDIELAQAAAKRIDLDGGQRVGPTGALLVRGLQGTDVSKKEKAMYCEMWVGQKAEGRKAKTSKSKKSTCPRWDDEWQVTLKGECCVKIRLYGDGWMGSCNMDLEQGFQLGGGHKIVSVTGNLRKSAKKNRAKIDPMGSLKLIFEFHPDAWQVLPPMLKPRIGHTTTLLNSGSVLIVGGCSAKHEDATGHCEVINPDKTHERNEVLMKYSRCYHTATKLQNGDVLICGGLPQEIHGNEQGYRHCEIFNGKKFVEAAPLKTPRYRHTAVLLQDGCVLVVGGLSADKSIGDGEVYDPKTNKWYSVTGLEKGVFGHTLTLMPTGRVFLLGGGSSKMPGELQINSMFYIPEEDKWIKGPTVTTPYLRHSILAMSDGVILLMPGSDWWTSYTPNKQQNYSTKVFAYDTKNPDKGLVPIGRTRTSCGTAVRLKGDICICFGGFIGVNKGLGAHGNWLDYSKHRNYSSSTEAFDGAWYSIDNMLAERTDNTATLLMDGRRVLIVGGMGPDLAKATPSIHLYSFNSSVAGQNCPEPETETFYGQTATPMKTKVVTAFGMGNAPPAKAPKATITQSAPPSSHIHSSDSDSKRRQAALADLKRDEGIVDVNDGFEDDDGFVEDNDGFVEDNDGFVEDNEGFAEDDNDGYELDQPQEADELDLDALVAKPNFSQKFSTMSMSAPPATKNYASPSQSYPTPSPSILDEADALLGRLAAPKPQPSAAPVDEKLLRARQGVQSAIGEVLAQLRTVTVDTLMTNDLSKVPDLINKSRILKTVKNELLTLRSIMTVQDYQVNATPSADKLEFAKAYLQQEINGLEGILNAVEFQLSGINATPPLIQVIQIMMKVKNIMKTV